jgi:hypothetical protein
VTYEIYPLHQPAVFEPGTRPEDVDTSQTEPGTYLVICTTLVHFVEAKMYGWVIVK